MIHIQRPSGATSHRVFLPYFHLCQLSSDLVLMQLYYRSARLKTRLVRYPCFAQKRTKIMFPSVFDTFPPPPKFLISTNNHFKCFLSSGFSPNYLK